MNNSFFTVPDCLTIFFNQQKIYLDQNFTVRWLMIRCNKMLPMLEHTLFSNTFNLNSWRRKKREREKKRFFFSHSKQTNQFKLLPKSLNSRARGSIPLAFSALIWWFSRQICEVLDLKSRQSSYFARLPLFKNRRKIKILKKKSILYSYCTLLLGIWYFQQMTVAAATGQTTVICVIMSSDPESQPTYSNPLKNTKTNK